MDGNSGAIVAGNGRTNFTQGHGVYNHDDMPNWSRRGPRWAGLVIAAATSLSAVGASQTPAQGQQTPRPTGVVIGRVIDGATNRPLVGVMVTISGAGIRPKRVIVDAQGRFLFHELPVGAFTVSASKAGYRTGSYGTLRPDGSGRSLDLLDGEQVTDATLRLWRFATISGTVIDDAGDPVPYARVQALKRTIVAGRWRLGNSNVVAADERGAYRITHLLPGVYALVITTYTTALPVSLQQVAVSMRTPGPESGVWLRELNGNGTGGYINDLMQGAATTRFGDLLLYTAGIVSADGRTLEVYPTVWYPAADSPREALLVDVQSGDNRTGIDLRPRLTKTVSVSGTVIGPDGPVPHLALRLVSARIDDAATEFASSMALSLTAAGAATDANGAFRFAGVSPGQYIIRVLTTPLPPIETPVTGPAPPPLVATDPTLWAATPVSVGETDTTGVTVTLRAGLRIRGRVEFAGTSPKPTGAELRAIRLSMDPVDGRTIARPTSYQAQVDAGGAFYTIGLVAGRYLLRMDSALKGWTLKSAIVNGRDICDVPLVLDTGDVDGVVLTFTDRPSDLRGIVRNAQGRPDDDATVLIFPSDGVWTDLGTSPRRMRGVRASRTGTFGVTGLPAGDYFVIAVSDAVASNWQDPAFLQKISRAATRVSLGDGQAPSLDLTTAGGIVR